MYFRVRDKLRVEVEAVSIQNLKGMTPLDYEVHDALDAAVALHFLLVGQELFDSLSNPSNIANVQDHIVLLEKQIRLQLD